MRKFFGLIGCFGLFSLSFNAVVADEAMQTRILKQQQAMDRHEFDFRRDAARKP